MKKYKVIKVYDEDERRGLEIGDVIEATEYDHVYKLPEHLWGRGHHMYFFDTNDYWYFANDQVEVVSGNI